MKTNKVIILGTGTSTGVPAPCCHCSVCRSSNPKNKRLRTSFLIQFHNGMNLLVDTTPDLRTQVLTHSIDHIEAAIITHDHADHIHGMDDLRPFCFGPPIVSIPIFTSHSVAKELTHRFPYIFHRQRIFTDDHPVLGGGIPLLDLRPVRSNHPITILGAPFSFFLLPHGHTRTLGFQQGRMAYIPDCSSVSKAIQSKLKRAQLDTLIIDCLRPGKHETHLHLEATLDIAETIGARFTGLIHMAHEFDHDWLAKTVRRRFGNRVAPLFDGQILKVRAT